MDRVDMRLSLTITHALIRSVSSRKYDCAQLKRETLTHHMAVSSCRVSVPFIPMAHSSDGAGVDSDGGEAGVAKLGGGDGLLYQCLQPCVR